MNGNSSTTSLFEPSPVPIHPTHNALKAILILTLFIATFLACMLAFAARRAAIYGSALSARIFSLLSVFGGGVFLATCLLDLLPDAVEGIQRAEEVIKYQFHFPVTELLVASGFLFVLIVEQVTLFVRERNRSSSSGIEHLIDHHEGTLSDPAADTHSHNSANGTRLAFAARRAAIYGSALSARIFSLLSVFGGGVFLATCLLDLLPDAVEGIQRAEEVIKYQFHFPVTELLVASGFLFVLIVEQVTLFVRERNRSSSSGIEHLIDHHEGTLSDPAADTHSHNSANGERSEDVHFDVSSHSTVRAALLVMALSLHAVFEGLSLGLILDVNTLIQIFGALLMHKTIIGFSLGLRLVQGRMRVFTVIVCCCIFSAQVLIGGFGGLAILDLISAGSAYKAALVSGGAQAIACGTFLYITCFEILPHELNQSGLRLVKLISLLSGFTLIAIMIALFPEDSSDVNARLLI
ncbi:Zinc transporter ZIP1 [Toxocara canis]|uniref:Zinc transporter ZIP1 n=1 Tax=Toxocara canis TaxID=6265 RepID=A0A0B2V4V5_TOXCA|nr:Zinc transporter ZIP1 [Toxocara canis]